MIRPSDQAVMIAVLRRETPARGMRKRLAYRLGTSETTLCRVIKGNHVPQGQLRNRILALARAEELALADRIEAELYSAAPRQSDPEIDADIRAIEARMGL